MDDPVRGRLRATANSGLTSPDPVTAPSTASSATQHPDPERRCPGTRRRTG